MAEDVKEEGKKAGANKVFLTMLKYILGVAFLILGVLAIFSWRGALLIVIQGCIGLFLILAGIITIAIAKE